MATGQVNDTRNPRLEAALSYARRGWHVFPCLAGLKVPATERGFYDATTDQVQIERWWTDNPHWNVAIATGASGLAVIDVDPAGLAHWDKLLADFPDLAEAARGAPRVVTPRDGFHIYLKGDGPTTTSKLTPGIDTRGAGGYVLAPPSYVNDGKSKGAYEGDLAWVEPVSIPDTFGERLAAMKAPVERSAPALPPEEIRWDMPETIVRAEAWLQTLVDAGDVAVEGCGGDQRTYEVCCRVLEMGITPDSALDLIARIWNSACRPPWDERELKIKIRNAWDYGQETRGGKAERPMEDEHKHLLDAPETPEDEARAAEYERFTPRPIQEARRNLKAPEWLVQDVIPRRGTGILYGPSQTFKTFVLLDLAMAISTGHGPNWWQYGDLEPRPVLYLAGEGPHAFKGQRIDAWLACNPLPGLLERSRLLVVDEVPPFDMHAYWLHMVEWLKERDIKPAMVVIDTLSRALMGMDENSAKDAGRATGKLDWLARQLDSFVVAVHHTGKDAARGMRGSYAWFGNVDVVLETDRRNERHTAVDVHIRKMKDGDQPDKPIHLEGAPFGSTLAFTRDWNYEEPEAVEAPEVPSGPGSEEWLQPEALVAVLCKGPHHTEHLAEALSQYHNVALRKVRRGLQREMKGRYKAWAPDGTVWKLPSDHPASRPEMEF
jgi:hypothetical protein